MFQFRSKWHVWLECRSLLTNISYLERYLVLVHGDLDIRPSLSLQSDTMQSVEQLALSPSELLANKPIQSTESPHGLSALAPDGLEAFDFGLPMFPITDGPETISPFNTTHPTSTTVSSLPDASFCSTGGFRYTHTTSKFRCETCNKRFSNVGNLNKHLNTAKAHNPVLHPCPNIPCKHGATTRHNLKMHIAHWCHNTRADRTGA